MKIFLKTDEEIELMREANQLVSKTHGELAKYIKPGVNTLFLDQLADTFIRDHGATPAFLGYKGFPKSICTSVNDEVVHGIPSDKVFLQDGDIISIDIGTVLNGFIGDSAYTYCVGEVSEYHKKLLRTTKEALYAGIAQALAGNRIGDISNAIHTYCETRNTSIVRELVGHGCGREMHEDPEVPNYGKRGNGTALRSGMCICIEPMVNQGSKQVVVNSDKWTIRTKDHQYSAHFEHCVAIRLQGPQLLSTFDYIEEIVGKDI